MRELSVKKWFSNDAGPFLQFVKYGIIGVLSTMVQVVVFYALATSAMPCLTPDDWAVRLFGLPSAESSDSLRGLYFAVATIIGFTIANLFCWAMNRLFVFKPGKFRWYAEFGLFYLTAAVATAISIAISWLCINCFGLMTTLAVFIEIIVSFLFNFFARKFYIFKN